MSYKTTPERKSRLGVQRLVQAFLDHRTSGAWLNLMGVAKSKSHDEVHINFFYRFTHTYLETIKANSLLYVWPSIVSNSDKNVENNPIYDES